MASAGATPCGSSIQMACSLARRRYMIPNRRSQRLKRPNSPRSHQIRIGMSPWETGGNGFAPTTGITSIYLPREEWQWKTGWVPIAGARDTVRGSSDNGRNWKPARGSP